MPSPARPDASAAPAKRVRLSPDIRRQQILDAALIEFSALGFAGTSIARIARRAGTSKANLYVHFASKDEIFETALRQWFAPPLDIWQRLASGLPLDMSIDAFIDETYAGLTPQTLSAVRLLIAESHRVPDLIQRWHEDTILPARQEQQQRVDRHVAEGRIGASVLTQQFNLTMAPVLQAAVTLLVFGPEAAQAECARIRETHRELLHLLLKPRPDAPASGA